jgi:4-hydroxyphenylpyruvate dioxygenase
VLNSETTGFANSAYLAQGTTVCDIGLSVSDAHATVERAACLGARPFSQPLGPGELDIPAIRGLSGSLLHFIDDASGLSDVWAVEFTATGTGDEDSANLTRIDHLAQTMSYDQMLSWSLFYTTLFQMQKLPMVDVVDPDGIVRSQALAMPNGAFRITLNGAETHRTMAGNFLADSFGASIQHIALATDDMFATAANLFERHFSPLPISPNYYADLATRFDLSEDLLARMRSSSILYDRDAGGEFFQLYSRPFAGGMFFEIVERRGGYTGYGAPNAPFRIAAQKRLMRAKGMPKR